MRNGEKFEVPACTYEFSIFLIILLLAQLMKKTLYYLIRLKLLKLKNIMNFELQNKF